MKQQRYESGGAINTNERHDFMSDKARRLVATAAVSSVAIFGLSGCGSEQAKSESDTSVSAEVSNSEYVVDRDEDARYFAEIANRHDELQKAALDRFNTAFHSGDGSISMDTVLSKDLGGQTDVEVRTRLNLPGSSTWGEWRVATLNRADGEVMSLEESLDGVQYTVDYILPQEVVDHQELYVGSGSVLTINDGYAKGTTVLLTDKFASPVTVDDKEVAGVVLVGRYKNYSLAHDLETAKDAANRFTDEEIFMDEMVVKMTDGSEIITNRDELMYLTKEFDISKPEYSYKGRRTDYEDTIDRYEFAIKVMEAM